LRESTFCYFFILCLSFYSCSSGGEAVDSDVDTTKVAKVEPVDFDLEQIRQRGVLNAIVDNSSTSYFLYKGQPMGYEYEMLARLAKTLDVRLNLIIEVDIDSAIAKLNRGEGDILAYGFTVTNQRKKLVLFTDYLYTVRQMLVQPKPEGWRKMKVHELESRLIRNQVDLIGEEVHVRRSSAFASRLRSLADEVGGEIKVVEGYENIDTEAMIELVAEGDIPLTVADEDIALVVANYFPDVDVSTPISFPQRIAWATRKTSVELTSQIDEWLAAEKKKSDIYVIYKRYFESPRSSLTRVKSEYGSISGSKISPYDKIIKKSSGIIGWDWRLIAAQIYQESKFDPKVKSWAGAEGLMQLMPATGKRFGAEDPFNPSQNITAGVYYLKWLEGTFKESVPDSTERVKFVLGSYNVGPGHVIDAQELAKKYGADPAVWDDNVAKYLLLKSQAKYFNDPVVKSGYCRGKEPYNYVISILERYEQYRTLLKESLVSL